MNFSEDTLTEAALARMSDDMTPRQKQVLGSLIRHLHAFARDVDLTEAEWFEGIRFLTATGQKCDDVRQEFILLSDVLGLSMMVDAINHRAPAGATETTVFGPFFRADAPESPFWGNVSAGQPGKPCFVSGQVRDVDGAPLADVLIDVWQTDGVDGLYDVQREDQPWYGRGRLRTDAQGRYAFRTVQPVCYPIPDDGPVGKLLRLMGRHPWRPAHIHTMLTRDGYQSVTTHLFVKGDQYLDSDAVFGVKDSLIVEFVDHPPGKAPDGSSVAEPFSVATYDFVMAPA
ncbi:MAG: intradiol ring-cleavage dioxygenase [Burkholderiaceae bacterium]